MMIEPIQTRVDELDSTCGNREIVHRGHINAENEKQTQELYQQTRTVLVIKMKKRSIK